MPDQETEMTPWLRYLLWTGGTVLLGVVLAVGVVLRQKSEAFNPPRARRLAQLVALQEKFHDLDLDKNGKKDYGTLKELERAGLLPESRYWATSGGSAEFWISPSRDSWAARISPNHPFQGTTLWVNQAGRIHAFGDLPGRPLASSKLPAKYAPYEGDVRAPSEK